MDRIIMREKKTDNVGKEVGVGCLTETVLDCCGVLVVQRKDVGVRNMKSELKRGRFGAREDM